MSVSYRALPLKPNSSSFKVTIPIILLWYSITWKGMVIISSVLQNEKAIQRMIPVLTNSSLLFHSVLLFPPALLSQFPLVNRADIFYNLSGYFRPEKLVAINYMSSFKIFLNRKYFYSFLILNDPWHIHLSLCRRINTDSTREKSNYTVNKN